MNYLSNSEFCILDFILSKNRLLVCTFNENVSLNSFLERIWSKYSEIDKLKIVKYQSLQKYQENLNKKMQVSKQLQVLGDTLLYW